jgi:hypothetical protein
MKKVILGWLSSLIVIGTVLTGFIPNIAIAQSGPELKVNGSILIASVNPGQSYVHTITLESPNAMNLSVEVRGLGQDMEGNTLPLTQAEDVSPYSARQFVIVDKLSVHLAANVPQDIKATVNIPSGTASGERYATVYMYQNATSSDTVIISDIVPVIITIPEFTRDIKGDITNLRVSSRIAEKPLDIVAAFKNTGNGRVMNGSYNVTIKDSNGNIKWQNPAGIADPSIVPTYSRSLTSHYSVGLPVGTYSATVEVKTLDGNVIATKSLTFDIVVPPAAPTLVKPGNNSQPGPYIDTSTPVFEWNPVSGADMYNLQIFVDPFGINDWVYDQSDLTGNSLPLPPEAIFSGDAFTWKVRAHNAGGWGDYSSQYYFRTSGSAPIISTSEATGVTVNTATLNGNLEAQGWERTSSLVSFEYGETTQYGTATSEQTMTSQGNFTTSISNLKENTTYHFRAKTVGASTAYGEDLTFTTGVPLVVTTGIATDIGEDRATLNATLVSLDASGTAQVSFEYGTTTGYGSTTGPQTKNTAGTFSTAVTGLVKNTTYHFRAKTIGLTTVYGKDVVFTTQNPNPTTSPTVSSTTTPPTNPTVRSYKDYFPPVIVDSSLVFQDFTDALPYFNAVDKTGVEVRLTGTNNKGTIAIIAARYDNEPHIDVKFASGITKGGMGKPWVKFVGVGVEGNRQGMATVTLHYTDKEISNFDPSSLFLAYYRSGKWRMCDNLVISEKDKTISGTIPVSRLASGAVIGLGGNSIKETKAAILPISNEKTGTGVSWSMFAIILFPILIVGIIILIINKNRRKNPSSNPE